MYVVSSFPARNVTRPLAFTTTATGSTRPSGPARWAGWISRDPIGEHGGINLYGFANNEPTGEIDNYGLFHGLPMPGVPIPGGPFTPRETPWACAERIAREVGQLPGRQDDPSSRYAHCLASCRISRECLGARFTAWLAGDWFQDPWWLSENKGSDPGDRKANKIGRDLSKCNGECEDLCMDALKTGRLY